MTENQATKIVVMAARAHSNGHEHCAEILEACRIVEASGPVAPVEHDVDWQLKLNPTEQART